MSLHTEINFENEICKHARLALRGRLRLALRPRPRTRPHRLDRGDATHVSWEALARWRKACFSTACASNDDRGTLEVLREGVDIIGLKASLALAQFKPPLGTNADILARYAANCLPVVRQVHYSKANENSIDLVLFLNGLPVSTVELKTDFTQSGEDAVDQYRFDRHPRPKGQNAEPLLSFPSGAVVHFAVSNNEVSMTTRLGGPSTSNLPFNKGDHGGKGNPPNPNGHPTSYLWEDVCARKSWLEILGRYIVAERDKNERIAKLIFPR